MVKVKVCGLTRLSDVIHAAECGADILGFVREPSSPRFFRDVQPVSAFHAYAPLVSYCAVFGPFRKESPIEGFSHVQSIDPQPEGSRHRWLRTIQVSEEDDVASLISRVGMNPVVLLDRASANHGGTGRTIDWGLAAELVAAMPMLKVILAGGLNPNNVAEAVRKVRPYAVDASSGLESAPGEKDNEKVRRFIIEAKQA